MYECSKLDERESARNRNRNRDRYGKRSRNMSFYLPGYLEAKGSVAAMSERTT